MAISTQEVHTAPSTNGTHPSATQKHVLILQTVSGTQHYSWTDEDTVGQQEAKDAFDQHRAAGYRVYQTNGPVGSSAPAEEVTAFDAKARELLGIMPMRGGSMA